MMGLVATEATGPTEPTEDIKTENIESKILGAERWGHRSLRIYIKNENIRICKKTIFLDCWSFGGFRRWFGWSWY